MGQFIKFLVVYGGDGDPVIYKVDETVMKSEIDKEGAFTMHMEFDMHVVTDEELEEYRNSNK